MIENEINILFENKRDLMRWISSQNEQDRATYMSAAERGLKVQHLSWIKKVKGSEPIEDIVSDVTDFLDRKTQQILKDNGYETDLNTGNYPTVNSLRILLQDISNNKDTTKHEQSLLEPSHVEKLGEVGKWQILFPLTEEGSMACSITGRDTTWCTQKAKGNAFYSYLKTPLIYIVDYSRIPDLDSGTDVDARLSVGFEPNGTPILTGADGSVSVDALNNGLTEERLRNILKTDFEEIMNIASSKITEIDGIHPARRVFVDSSKNLLLLKKTVKKMKKEDKSKFYYKVIKLGEPSDMVLNFLSSVNDSYIRAHVAMSPKATPELLSRMADDKEEHVRFEVAGNENSTVDTLSTLHSDQGSDVRAQVAKRSDLPFEIYLSLAKDDEFDVRLNVASNPSTPPELLYAQSEQDPSFSVRYEAKNNPSFPS